MTKHLIYSRNATDTALSAMDIFEKAPAVFSTSSATHLSDRYVPLQTSSIIPVMKDYGFDVVQAVQKRSHKETNKLHNAHMLAFANTSLSFEDGTRPEVVLYNSGDGTSAVRLFAGVYRMICSNGLIAGEGFESRTYHTKKVLSFEDNLRHIVNTLPDMMTRVEKLKSVQLDRLEAFAMAAKAVSTRWDMYTPDAKAGSYIAPRTAEGVLNPQRIEDTGNDAFTIFNRIQESIIRGNTFVRSVTAIHPEGVLRKARPVGSISEAVRINRELWDIAEAAIA